jgi:predicted RNase H-like HicB family nuclease
MAMRQFTEVIERDEDWYVALCPELDIAGQGESVEEARRSLIEAIELFFEVASPSEIQERIRSEVFVIQVGVDVA